MCSHWHPTRVALDEHCCLSVAIENQRACCGFAGLQAPVCRLQAAVSNLQAEMEGVEPRGFYNVSQDPQTHSRPADPQTRSRPADPQTHSRPADPQTRSRPADPQTHSRPADPQTHSRPADPQTHRPTQEGQKGQKGAASQSAGGREGREQGAENRRGAEAEATCPSAGETGDLKGKEGCAKERTGLLEDMSPSSPSKCHPTLTNCSSETRDERREELCGTQFSEEQWIKLLSVVSKVRASWLRLKIIIIIIIMSIL
jgi:hypothetical protein